MNDRSFRQGEEAPLRVLEPLLSLSNDE
jgi:hypothetical protein